MELFFDLDDTTHLGNDFSLRDEIGENEMNECEESDNLDTN